MNTSKAKKISLILNAILLISLISACGSAPKEVDHEGLRDRADQETSQVK